MELTTVLCVLCALTSVNGEVYSGMPNQHVPNYITYLDYVNVMHHRPDKYPGMSYYGSSFGSHGSYKFNPHIIPNCKTVNLFVCCQTKYMYKCSNKPDVQVSSVIVPPKPTFTSTVIPVTTSTTKTIVSTTPVAPSISTTIDTTPTSKLPTHLTKSITTILSTSPIYIARETYSTIPSKTSTPVQLLTDSTIFVPTTEETIHNIVESTITSTVTKYTTVTSDTSNLDSDDNGRTDSTINGSDLDISTTVLTVSDSTSGMPTTIVATSLTTIPALPESTIAAFLTSTDINILVTTGISDELTTEIENGEEPVTTGISDVLTTTIMSPSTEADVSSPISINIASTSSGTIETFVRTTLPIVTTDITGSGIGGTDPDMEASGSGEVTDMESGDDEITEFEENEIAQTSVTTSIYMLTTAAMNSTTKSSVSNTTPVVDTEEIIDIDESLSSEHTTVTFRPTVITTSSGIGGTDPDMETSGSGEVIDMESGDDEIRTTYEGSGITGSSVTTSISMLTTATMNSTTRTSVSSTTPIVDTEETIDIDENLSSEHTTVTFLPSSFPTVTTAITSSGIGGTDSDMETSGSGEVIDMESGDDEITTAYEGSGLTGSSVTTSISVLTTATITSTEASAFNPATEEIIDIDGSMSPEITTVTIIPITFTTGTTDITGSGVSGTDTNLEASGEPTDMESGDDDLITRHEGSGMTTISFTTEASISSISSAIGTEKIISSLLTEPAVSTLVSTLLPINDTGKVSATVIYDVSTGFIDMEGSGDIIDPDMEGSGVGSGDGSGDVSESPIIMSSVKNIQLPNEV